MKQSKIYPVAVLGSICLAVALLLSAINMITAPIIADREAAAANAALVEVLPGGKDFKELEITDAYPSVVKAGWSADGGFVFKMSVAGYQPGLIIMCGVSADGKVVGVKHIDTKETYGYENELNGAYVGQDYDNLELIIASGATPNSSTSKAYYDAIKAALQSAILASGGAVDTRGPEEILQDNCNAALGTEGKTFTKWFATEELVGVDAVYETADDSGRVYKIGESLIGVADGAVTTADVDDETAAAVIAADAIVAASTTTEITDLDGFGAEITKAYVTASGNYVFELSAKGYDVTFKYSEGNNNKNPQPIIIKLSISAEGRIIDCVTVKHSETKGDLGDSYRNQWIGATNGDFTVVQGVPSHNSTHTQGQSGPGVISGATYTTQGYQKAVKAAFEAFELITASEGGNE